MKFDKVLYTKISDLSIRFYTDLYNSLGILDQRSALDNLLIAAAFDNITAESI